MRRIAMAAIMLAMALAGPAGAEEAPTGTLLPRLEQALGRPLDARQRQGYGRLVRHVGVEMSLHQARFAARLGAAVGLTRADIEPLLPAPGAAEETALDLAGILERRLGRALTEAERSAIGEAETERRGNMAPLRAEFAGRLAELTGLAPEALRPLLPAEGF